MDTFRISDAELLSRLESSEDSFVERKSLNDMRDVVKSIQKTIKDKLSVVYPPLEYKTREIRKSERRLLAVIVPGSAKGPHFSGAAYVREGSSTVVANEELFSRIVDKRDRKVREILKWKDQRILMRRYVTSPA